MIVVRRENFREGRSIVYIHNGGALGSHARKHTNAPTPSVRHELDREGDMGAAPGATNDPTDCPCWLHWSIIDANVSSAMEHLFDSDLVRW